MTIPSDYLYADRDFRAFMERAKEVTGHETTSMAWGTLLGVFEVFRRRLDPNERLTFGAVLPPTLRAIFHEAGTCRATIPFAARDVMAREVQAVHRDHQFANDTAIDDVAEALSAFVDRARFATALAALGPEAEAFWSKAIGEAASS